MPRTEVPLTVERPSSWAKGWGYRLSLRGGTPLYDILKRVLDVLVSVVALILFLPLFPFIALAIVLDSPGPVFFCQERIGKGGRPFCVYKFRSMVANADPTLHRQYVRRLMAGSSSSSRADTLFKIDKDPRITRVGSVLRKTSLDELPQLINVLKGEMTLVGLRPDLPYSVREYEPWQRRRLDALPGLTGLWQVSGRSRLSPREMMELDVRYVNERTLWLDIAILLKTIPCILWMRDSC
jgi:lipopolysaccharide/colanic/teichoic acid biosynthesis glycosyltransferase